MKFSEFYDLKRGIMGNPNGYVLWRKSTPDSVKFLSILKETIENEYGVGASLNSIITGVPNIIGFHHKKDYDYYMKKTKQRILRENLM